MVNGQLTPGELQAFDGTTGVFISSLAPPAGFSEPFHPRGVVIGPDGLLYVSNMPNPPPEKGICGPSLCTGLDGDILRFDPATGNFKIFVSNTNPAATQGACKCDFNRPEGLVFGPDGNLYVTSFRASSSDTDKILIFAGPANPNAGKLMGQIDLDHLGQDRAYAQALLFGPSGKLFRAYNHAYGTLFGASAPLRCEQSQDHPHPFDIFVPSSSTQNSPLGSGWYLTFGNTNPVTLNYLPTCAAGSC